MGSSIMNIIMNKNMKKRLDVGIDVYFFASGSAGTNADSTFRTTRVGGANPGNSSTKLFADVGSAVAGGRPYSWPASKNRIYPFKSLYNKQGIGTFQRKFSRVVVKLMAQTQTIFTQTIDMISGTTWTTRYNVDSTTRLRLSTHNGVTASALSMIYDEGTTLSAVNNNNNHPAYINFPVLQKTISLNGIPYSQAKVIPTIDGNVRVSLIAPLDVQPTLTGVNLDSFQIEFFDDFDRPTAIVTGTIGDLNSTADVKMANTLIEDGAYINISGMDDFLITTPNTIAISN
jgi:hypothetical protein